MKNFGAKLKTMVTKSGHTEETEDIKQLKERYYLLLDHYEKLMKGGKNYIGYSQKSAKEADKFAEVLINFALCNSDTDLGELMAKIAECQKSINNLQLTLMTSLLEGFLAPGQKFLEELKKETNAKRNLQHAHSKFDSATTKVKKLQTEKNSTKLQQAEDELKDAQQNFELAQDQFNDTIKELQQKHNEELTVQLKNYFNAQLCFFGQGYTLLAELENSLETNGKQNNSQGS
eukprot:TRINITY_DN8097_c0_g1_i1.p1 TRINITY_DN8097_c0_g1~~TRINITY_DN8097_c0_g1_i1.p1  ORF type:complete len:232 (-),score=42.53 TRINITY_DN8097_c0_g1_i1:41-736(-)